jgi:hypothetical protein
MRRGCTFRSLTKAPMTYDDFYLPSYDELNEMHAKLHLFGVGDFVNIKYYWSSTEDDATQAYAQFFFDGVQSGFNKNNSVVYAVRACRSFTSTINYNLRDIGPAGGLIFWKNGDDYLEAAPSDQSVSQSWSNIINIAIGVAAQGTAIGTGQANTTAIIGQMGHTGSAAKLCDDLVIVH